MGVGYTEEVVLNLQEYSMTFSELEINVKKLKFNEIYCNLFKDFGNAIGELGLYVNKKGYIWEVFETNRSNAKLACVFYDESSLCEYVFCYFKKFADCERWFGGLMTKYPDDLINKLRSLKIPEYDFSSYVHPKVIIDNGEFSHVNVQHEDGSASFYIFEDRFANGGKADVWEVNYSDENRQRKCGVFFEKNYAYDFIYYLIMKKYVNIKKRWW